MSLNRLSLKFRRENVGSGFSLEFYEGVPEKQSKRVMVLSRILSQFVAVRKLWLSAGFVLVCG